MSTIETVNGNLINVTNPDPANINMDDIAWALSRINRFAGHTTTLIPYNVAQHSCFVAKIINQIWDSNDAFGPMSIEDQAAWIWCHENSSRSNVFTHALIHDAHEAYTGDIPSPMKHHPDLYPVIKEIENRLQRAIESSLNLTPPDRAVEVLVHYADKVAQAIEANAFMPSRGRDWGLPKIPLLTLQEFDTPKTSVESYKEFHYFLMKRTFV